MADTLRERFNGMAHVVVRNDKDNWKSLDAINKGIDQGARIALMLLLEEAEKRAFPITEPTADNNRAIALPVLTALVKELLGDEK